MYYLAMYCRAACGFLCNLKEININMHAQIDGIYPAIIFSS